MNIHPIVVHFPIALLSTYAVLEFIRFKKIVEKDYWFYIKAVFVIVGSLATGAALFTGNLIEHEFRGVKELVDVHSTWAVITIIIFGIIAAAYIISWIQRECPNFLQGNKLWQFLVGYKDLVFDSRVIIILALLGLVAVTITGSLGAAIVYGPNFDPMVTFVYNLFLK